MIARLEAENNVKVKLIVGEEYSILGLVGDISTIDKHIPSTWLIMLDQGFKSHTKRASRKFIRRYNFSSWRYEKLEGK